VYIVLSLRQAFQIATLRMDHAAQAAAVTSEI
jgi:hypothetical protein